MGRTTAYNLSYKNMLAEAISNLHLTIIRKQSKSLYNMGSQLLEQVKAPLQCLLEDDPKQKKKNQCLWECFRALFLFCMILNANEITPIAAMA